MSQAVRYYAYKPGETISVYDEWLERWREATVVTASLTLITVVSGGFRYDDLPATPKYVRPMRIVRGGGLAVRRAA